MTFNIRLTFTDRRQGPSTGRSIRAEAASMPGAVSKATREFWRSLDRKQRNDVRRGGLKVEATKI